MTTKHYYALGNALYQNKIEALHAASRTKQQVTWHWHDEFDSMPWQLDPPWSLREMYKLRAQQLRDSYNYLILSFSGGSDSWTVLHSFITNRIHLDEVFFRWPFSATQSKYVATSQDLSPCNHLSEWDLNVKPMLDQLAISNPEIKITLHDCSESILATVHNDNLVSETGGNLSRGWWAKWNSMGELERKMIDSGKTTALILGVDKPQLFVENKKMYCYFLDIHVNNNTTLAENGRTNEFFYWSPNMPEVTYTQARAIYNHVKFRHDVSQLIDRKTPYDRICKHTWDRIARSIIYPDYDLKNFQTCKDQTSIDIKTETWLNLYSDHKFLDRWRSLVHNILTSIDREWITYCDGQISGFHGFISKPYYLGDIVGVDQ